MNLVPLSPFAGRGNVATPWWVGSKGAEFQYLTMASPDTQPNSRQVKRAHTEVEAADHSDDNLPSANHDRWFIMQSADDDTSLSKLTVFMLAKALKGAAGDLKTIKRLDKGDILLETSSASQSRCLLKLNNLVGCPILVTPHKSLNTSKGVILCKELVDCTKEEILSELKEQSVKDIFNITVNTDSGIRRKTNTFIITFCTPAIPKYLKIGYIRVPVSIYIPNPLRCFKCQKFGHGSRTCKGDTRCPNCGQVGHSSNDCHGQLKCCNCSGAHSASSKECPKWVLEKKVQQIKAEKGISFVEARKIATSENRTVPTPRGQSMAL